MPVPSNSANSTTTPDRQCIKALPSDSGYPAFDITTADSTGNPESWQQYTVSCETCYSKIESAACTTVQAEVQADVAAIKHSSHHPPPDFQTGVMYMCEAELKAARELKTAETASRAAMSEAYQKHPGPDSRACGSTTASGTSGWGGIRGWFATV